MFPSCLKDLRPWKGLFILVPIDPEQSLGPLEGVCHGTSSFPSGQAQLCTSSCCPSTQKAGLLFSAADRSQEHCPLSVANGSGKMMFSTLLCMLLFDLYTLKKLQERVQKNKKKRMTVDVRKLDLLVAGKIDNTGTKVLALLVSSLALHMVSRALMGVIPEQR